MRDPELRGAWNEHSGLGEKVLLVISFRLVSARDLLLYKDSISLHIKK
jgi:hypothetical protein